MIALFDFVPSFCPNCGAEIDLKGRYNDPNCVWGRGPRKDQDYKAGASHRCRGCDLHYQYCDTGYIIDASINAGGDLCQHVPLEK